MVECATVWMWVCACLCVCMREKLTALENKEWRPLFGEQVCITVVLLRWFFAILLMLTETVMLAALWLCVW